MRKLLPALVVCSVAALTWGGEDSITLTPSASTSINPSVAGEATREACNAEDLMIYGPKHESKDYRALLQFDLKDVPKQPVLLAVMKVTLYKMYAIRKNKRDIIRVQQMVRPWNEATASWGCSVENDEWINKGGDFNPVSAAATSVTDELGGESSGKTIEFDVTALVQAWLAGQPNFGMCLLNVDNDSNTTCRPFSRKAKNPADRPQLTIYFANPPKKSADWMMAPALKPVGGPVTMNVQLNPSLRQMRVGEKYIGSLKAKGGIAPYTVIVKGELPEGLTVSTAGLIEGAPKKPGKYPLSVSITDASHHSGSGRITLDVIQPDPGKKDDGGKKDDSGKKPSDVKTPDTPKQPVEE